MKNTKSNPFRLSALAAAAALGVGSALAAPFTPGNLVVERLGNGTETLATTGNSIFFDEYSKTGSLVQSIALPDGTNGVSGTSILEVGSGGTTGAISLSPDGQTLVFPGYATNFPNAAVLTTNTAAVVPRAIGQLNGNGVYSMVTSNTVGFSGSNIRGAATDGEGNFWASGTAATTTANAGVFYFGTSSAAADVFSANLRGVRVYNGQLWFDSASSTPGDGIYAFNGQPTTAATATVIVPLGANDSTYNFVVSPDGTVIYDADDGGFATNSSGIHKWTGSGTNWTLQYILMNTPTNGEVFGLAVDWKASPVTIYATTAFNTSTNKLIMVQDNGAASTNFTLLATAGAKEYFRGVSFVPTNIVGTVAPSVTGIFPATTTANAGATVALSVSALGTAPLSYFWYQVVGPNNVLIPSATSDVLTLSSVSGANNGNYFAVVSNSSGLTATSGVVSVSVTDPVITGNPGNSEAFLGDNAPFMVSAAGTGLTYQWYFSDINGNTKGIVPATFPSGSGAIGTTSATLTLTNVQLADAPTNFVVVVTGTYGMVTSTVATLEAVNTTNTLQYSQFAPPGFPGFDSILGFWDFNGPNFNTTAPRPFIGDGTATLVNLPANSTTVADPNDGADANFPEGQNLPNGAWGTSGYSTTSGTNIAVGSNLLSGVQFNVSTVGARNITVLYDGRVSATASQYDHLQYTIDGVTWSNYPASSTFGGHSGTGNGGFIPFGYNLAGFPGVDNNSNFGVRIMTEFQSTATYGAGLHGLVTNGYAGTANTYGTGGTLTYDIFQIAGDDIADNFAIPTVSCSFPTTNLFMGFPATNTLDNVPITVNLTVGSPDMPASNLTLSATVLGQVNVNNPAPTANASFAFGGTDANRTMTINPQPINDNVDAAPVLVTVTDTNGLTGVAWFYLTLNTQFPPPTNSLVAVTNTNMLANTTLTIPFVAGTTNVALNNLTFGVTSDNNTLVPSTSFAIMPNPVMNANPTLSNVLLVVTPTPGQVGLAEFSLTVSDNNNAHNDPKSTTSTTVLEVRPNTNVVLIDYFGYNTPGSLDTVAAGFWSHLTGINLQLQVDPAPVGGFALVDCADSTENLQAPLLGAPYAAAGATTLYSSFLINMNPNGAINGMPVGNGSAAYFMVYNDGTGVTGDYEGGVYASTNGAAPGFYRLGIGNWAGNGNEDFSRVPFFPMDLAPGSNYVVVTALAMSNGFSTLWVNPVTGQSSASVTDTVSATTAGATQFPISALEFRESSSGNSPPSDPGIVAVSHLKVGKTFDSVFPSLQVQNVGTNVVVNWSDPTLGILSSTNVAGPYAPVTGAVPPYTNTTTNATEFYLFGQ